MQNEKVFLSILCGFFMMTICNAQVAETLSQNNAFIENIKILNELSSNVDKNFGENLKALSDQIEISKSKVMSYEESISQTATLLMIDENKLSENLNKFKENYLILKAEFGESLNAENVSEAAKKIETTISGRSASAYSACCVLAAATGFTVFAACTGASWGFGAPWCFAGAVVVQTAAIHLCAHNYL